MAGSNSFTVGTAPSILASAPPNVSFAGPVGWFSFTNGGTAPVIIAGGTQTTTLTGPSLAAGGTLQGWLFPGDSLWGATTGGSAVSFAVLQTGM